MAVTITNNPNTLNASRRYIRFTATSNRLASLAYTTITVDASGGFCRYTLGAGHGVLADDVITGTLFEAYFNVRQKVTAKTATEIITDLAFPTSTTDVIGTVTRTNDNFKLRCLVKVGATTVATLYKQAVSSVFTFYVERSIDTLITYTIPVSAILQSPCVNHYSTFTIEVAEYFDNKDGLSTLCADAAATSSAYNAIKASRTDIEPMAITFYDVSAVGGGNFLSTNPDDYTDRIYNKAMKPLCFYSNSITDITVNYRQYDAAFGVIASLTSVQTLTGKYGIIDVGKLIASTTRYLLVWLTKTSTGATISGTQSYMVDWKSYSNRVGVYFINRNGAWERFDFTQDYETYDEQDKRELRRKLSYGYTSASRSKETFYSQPKQMFSIKSHFVSYATALWLHQLAESKQVFLESGGGGLYPLNNIEMDIPANLDNTQLIQVTFKAELYNIV